jgi:hypothetical protein
MSHGDKSRVAVDIQTLMFTFHQKVPSQKTAIIQSICLAKYLTFFVQSTTVTFQNFKGEFLVDCLWRKNFVMDNLFDVKKSTYIGISSLIFLFYIAR